MRCETHGDDIEAQTEDFDLWRGSRLCPRATASVPLTHEASLPDARYGIQTLPSCHFPQASHCTLEFKSFTASDRLACAAHAIANKISKPVASTTHDLIEHILSNALCVCVRIRTLEVVCILKCVPTPEARIHPDTFSLDHALLRERKLICTNRNRKEPKFSPRRDRSRDDWLLFAEARRGKVCWSA